MKKLIALLLISFLINGCNSSPNIDVTEIETEPSFFEFTEDEVHYYNDYFKSVTEKYNLKLIDKDHFEIYMGDTIASREKFYEFVFLDEYKTKFKIFLDSNKSGCSLRIELPYEQPKFHSENQLNLFLDLYSLIFSASEESKKHFFDLLISNYNNDVLWEQKSEHFEDVYLENLVFPLEGSGLYNLLTFGSTKKICI
ncbi:hypothetical protein [Erysipelothrix rhusiopathiae]|uniref:hypothetical protein n=1 Tax=Erysipelothrix rhusiopathiae TaxID=1648 RepID=UPI003BF5F12E